MSFASMCARTSQRAKAKQGSDFDLKAYHSAVLRYGRVPLDLLRQIGTEWIAQT